MISGHERGAAAAEPARLSSDARRRALEVARGAFAAVAVAGALTLAPQAAGTASAREASKDWAASPRKISVRPTRRPAEIGAQVIPSPGGALDSATTLTAFPADSGAPAAARELFARAFAKGRWTQPHRSRPLVDKGGKDASLPRRPRSGPVGFVLAKLSDRTIISRRNADEGFIPASVSKVPTALYAMDTLGLDYRFKTRLIGTGPIKNGVLQGDLYLVGGGDPVLDTKDLLALLKQLKDVGLKGVSGKFYVDDQALPKVFEIEPGQPVYASYNPGLSGLMLNFSRVLFVWGKEKKTRFVALRVDAHSPNRDAPGFEAGRLGDKDKALFRRSVKKAGSGAADGDEIVHWRVSPRKSKRPGRRWLPVHRPSLHTALTFQMLAAEKSITLPDPIFGAAPPISPVGSGATLLAEHESASLSAILRGMLRYSTNSTAEVVGLTSTGALRLRGADVGSADVDPSRSLQQSGAAMADWANEEFGLIGGEAGPPMVLFNHSGLTAASRVSPRAMVQMLVNVSSDPEAFEKFYKLMPVRRGRGAHKSAIVRAKTGTIYYGRGLAGYIECRKSGEIYVFAYFNSDPEARKKFEKRIDVTSPSPPSGAGAWLNGALAVERALIGKWTKGLCNK